MHASKYFFGELVSLVSVSAPRTTPLKLPLNPTPSTLKGDRIVCYREHDPSADPTTVFFSLFAVQRSRDRRGMENLVCHCQRGYLEKLPSFNPTNDFDDPMTLGRMLRLFLDWDLPEKNRHDGTHLFICTALLLEILASFSCHALTETLTETASRLYHRVVVPVEKSSEPQCQAQMRHSFHVGNMLIDAIWNHSHRLHGYNEHNILTGSARYQQKCFNCP